MVYRQHGVARMCRLLAVLQLALASLGAAGSALRPKAERAFESGCTVLVDTLLKAAGNRPGRFTPAEDLALLQARSLPVKLYLLYGLPFVCAAACGHANAACVACMRAPAR